MLPKNLAKTANTQIPITRRVVFFEGMEEEIENNENEMFEKYAPPIYKEYNRIGIRKEGHGGVDWLICRAFNK